MKKLNNIGSCYEFNPFCQIYYQFLISCFIYINLTNIAYPGRF